MEKICLRCNETKDVSKFHRDRKRKDGYNVYCKSCMKEKAEKYYKQNAKKLNAQGKKWREENRFKASLWSSKKDAKRRGHLPCNATEEELEIAFSGKCDVCSVSELKLTTKLCLDHSHSTGEFRGFLCRKCNTMLGGASDDPEILRLGALYIEENG